MVVRKWLGDLIAQYPNMKLANSVSESDLGCVDCKHTMYIPCFAHPYCINPKSPSYRYHIHSWDSACEFYEEGEQYKEFECPYFDGVMDCDFEKKGNSPCPYEHFD